MVEDFDHVYNIVDGKCRELKMAGITVFRGLEGYGDTAAMHRHQPTP
jgi:PII-like signaling protein